MSQQLVHKGTFQLQYSKQIFNIFNVNICKNVTMRIEKTGESTAAIYFINSGGDSVETPEGFRVYDITNDTDVPHFYEGSHSFVICFIDKYRITYQNKIVVELQPVKTWDILAPANNRIHWLNTQV